MRRFLPLGLVVPLAAGCGWFSGHEDANQTPGSSAARDVPRWVQVEHLPTKALPGAELFAASGCTACHTYAVRAARTSARRT